MPTSLLSSSSGGNRSSSYDPRFGGIPAPVNVSTELSKAISSALSNFGSLTNLAGKTNAFQQQEILDQLTKAFPGYGGLVGKSANVISDHLSGLIPADVQAAVQDSAAARSLSGGYGGSGLHGNLVARDLGLTSMGLQTQGLSELLNAIGSTRATATSDPFRLENFMVTPSQAIEVSASNKAMAAAPVPKAKAEYEKSIFDQYYGMGAGGSPRYGKPLIGGSTAIPAGGGGGGYNFTPLIGSKTPSTGLMAYDTFQQSLTKTATPNFIPKLPSMAPQPSYSFAPPAPQNLGPVYGAYTPPTLGWTPPPSSNPPAPYYSQPDQPILGPVYGAYTPPNFLEDPWSSSRPDVQAPYALPSF